MRSAPFPWVILAAWAVLWFAPRINQWIDRSSRPSRPQEPAREPITRPDRLLEWKDDR